VKVIQAAAVMLLGSATMALAPAGAEAKGCIKGAIVGGVAGHVLGHGKVGAVAGCVIGHHNANKDDNAGRASAGQRNNSH
jgi:hypothetical protein